MLNNRIRVLGRINTHVLFLSLLLFIAMPSGCNSNRNTPEQNMKAIRGIAFLIIEANYADSMNEEPVHDGIKFSRYWLAKQSTDRKKKLEELSFILSSLIINLNIEYLEKMTDQTEHIAGRLDEETSLKYEYSINEEKGFSIEWQEHKNELNEKMIKSIEDFHERLKDAPQKEYVISIVREFYTQSQPVLRQLMENRIKQIFH